ncbi:type II toxin-antitoxin system RelE/ParE family toxin [Candidatus Regiella insecticola]|uniref:Plasmid stabilization protein n=1 Tax=Candidatus Regiella insecticola TaxID=138073 RepID=A0A6L2ZR68_9ENTR|nr:type II toxin-antitoxin system RelE/ParE family toxin [Candidatus Regiella insecticola]GFN47273.1 plasmid stabilization protein [Candidatus Regiella insecticola]
MSKIELAPEVGDDIDRIIEHLTQYKVIDMTSRIQEIIQAIAVLEHNPLIGRPVSGDKRELVIGHRSRGYMALYRYLSDIDTVFVLALRSQKELGYASDVFCSKDL